VHSNQRGAERNDLRLVWTAHPNNPAVHAKAAE
jgi:hypothetical protein